MPKVDLALAKTFFKTTNPHLSYKNIISKLNKSVFSSVSEKSKALEMAKKTVEKVITPKSFKFSLVRETPNKEAYRLVITSNDIISDMKSKSINESILDTIKQHITRFNVSSRKGIQGCHGREFFDRIFKLTNKVNPGEEADITTFINKYINGDRFSRVLSKKNPDGSINMVFSRPRNPDINIENFKMDRIADIPEFSLCTYTCKNKNYTKTVCSVKTLKDILKNMRTRAAHNIQMQYMSRLPENEANGRGIFRLATSNHPQYFFMCDSSIYPVEQNFVNSRLNLNKEGSLNIPVLQLFKDML